MESVLTSPAAASIFGIPTAVFAILIPVVGTALFAYIIIRRLRPLFKAAPDDRFCCIGQRIGLIVKIWLAQWRHPRYMLAGILHIFIFAGFIILGARSTQLVILGFSENFVLP
ncbi:MAG: electron transfer flavoprotein, partial [Desulfobacterales bacterium]